MKNKKILLKYSNRYDNIFIKYIKKVIFYLSDCFPRMEENV